MSVYEHKIKSLDGSDLDLAALQGRATLVVNVASRCGLTPQYAGLEKLQETYGERGLTVLGVPCNQFGGQEPGSPQEIAEFCSTSYGISFPMTEKVDVNGADRHPLYQTLAATPDAAGTAGDVLWNFEKFLVAPDGTVAARFRPKTAPDDPDLIAAVESHLPH
jgi:glutathione peroxidase